MIQCSSFIVLYSGIIGTGHFISVLKGQFYKRNYRKMTILWSFSYMSFIKLQVKKFGGATKYDPTHYIQICVIIMCVIKGLHYISY